MNRREFLWLSGAAGGALALAPMMSNLFSAGDVSDLIPAGPGLESWTSTTCLMCPGGCGLRVRRVDGFPVGIAGNPNHPVNAGGVCTEGMAALQMLYHPDRVTTPLGRIDRQRQKPLEAISWDQALEGVGKTLRELREQGKPQKLGFVLGRTGGTMEALIRRFMSVWGSPNLFVDVPQDGCAQVMEAMHGLALRPAYDFNGTSLVLSFGADLLDAWQSPLHFQRSFAGFRSPTRTSKAQLIVADVRLSRTASRAQEWVGIAPGSYGALALGIAYVMLREKLYDLDFAATSLYGFEDFTDDSGTLRTGYRNLVLRDYSPEVVSRLTGVAVEKILALGKTFAESASAVAVFDENVTAQPGGLYAAMAIHSLNLLKGNLNRPGGIYLQPEVPLKPLYTAGTTGERGSKELVVEDLTSLEAAAGSLDILFLYYSNPVFSSPLGKRLEAVLAKIPTVVSFSPFLDETSHSVDVCLPDCVFLERWEDRLFPSALPVSGWSVVQPAVKPASQVRATGDVLLELSRRVGAPVAEALPWKTFEEVLKYRAQGLHEARAGTLCQDPFQQGLVAEIESRGWWFPEPESFDEFWKNLVETGAWLDPNYQVRVLRDYSGHADAKVDLYSRLLRTRLQGTARTVSDTECLPHYHGDEAAPVASEYSMTLNPYRLGKLGGGTSATLPWILQRAGLLQKTYWNSWVEVHPRDAQKAGIQNLDWVWLESPHGKLKVRAVIFAGTAPGLLNMPSGMGHREMGRWAQRRGVNPLEFLAGTRDPLTGIPHRFGTKVKFYKA